MAETHSENEIQTDDTDDTASECENEEQSIHLAPQKMHALKQYLHLFQEAFKSSMKLDKR